MVLRYQKCQNLYILSPFMHHKHSFAHAIQNTHQQQVSLSYHENYSYIHSSYMKSNRMQFLLNTVENELTFFYTHPLASYSVLAYFFYLSCFLYYFLWATIYKALCIYTSYMDTKYKIYSFLLTNIFRSILKLTLFAFSFSCTKSIVLFLECMTPYT